MALPVSQEFSVSHVNLNENLPSETTFQKLTRAVFRNASYCQSGEVYFNSVNSASYYSTESSQKAFSLLDRLRV